MIHMRHHPVWGPPTYADLLPIPSALNCDVRQLVISPCQPASAFRQTSLLLAIWHKKWKLDGIMLKKNEIFFCKKIRYFSWFPISFHLFFSFAFSVFVFFLSCPTWDVTCMMCVLVYPSLWGFEYPQWEPPCSLRPLSSSPRPSPFHMDTLYSPFTILDRLKTNGA